MKVYFLLFVLVQIALVHAEPGRNNGNMCRCCSRQSPINIMTNNTINVCISNPLEWSVDKYDAFYGGVKMENYSVELTSDWISDPVFLFGGPIKHNYVLDNIHWHWGNESDYGSEHMIDNNLFPIEMHIVTHRSTFSNLNEAVASNDPAAIVVIGYLFEINEKPSPGLAAVTLALSKLGNSMDSFKSVFEYSLLGEECIPNFYCYYGSLTTVPYSENVLWVVSKSILRISPQQLNEFRQLEYNGVNLSNNFREIQPINLRTVYSYNIKKK